MRRLEEKLAASSGDPQFREHGASLEVVANFVRSKKVSPEQAGIVKAAACGVLWYRFRLLASGLAIDGACELCGGNDDSIHHRLWWCDAPAALEARSRCCTPALIQQARQAGPKDKTFNAGWLQKSSWPAPAQGTCEICEIVAPDGTLQQTEPANFKLEGLVFQDGSLMPALPRAYGRAAWAALGLSESGAIVSQITGLVPACFPQTAAAAEWLGYAAYRKYACGETVGHQDYLNIVKQHDATTSKKLQGRAVYPGVWKHIGLEPPLASQALKKVKAHTAEPDPQVSKQKWLEWRGNHLVDLAAKNAVARHPQPTTLEAQQHKDKVKCARAVCAVIANVLPLWPKVPAEEIRAAAEEQRARQKAAKPKKPGTHTQVATLPGKMAVHPVLRHRRRRGRQAAAQTMQGA